MPEPRVIGRHVVLSVAFVLAFLLLNRPEVIVISRLGAVVWYPGIGLGLAIMLGISPWYAFPVTLASALSGILIYHQPVLTYSGTIEAAVGAAIYAGEATRASDVIVRIRALLRKAPPRMGQLDVNEVIREVLSLVRIELTTAGVTARTRLAANLPNVLGDRIQLQQVILNLVMNAIEAMTTIKDHSRTLQIKSSKHADGVMVQVRDSGVGIDCEKADRIFDPFFTTKSEGIGMGLAISRAIIEAHGGRLWAERRSSQGAVFQFALPEGSKA